MHRFRMCPRAPTPTPSPDRLTGIGVGLGLAFAWVLGYVLKLLRWRGAKPYIESLVVLATAYLTFYVAQAGWVHAPNWVPCSLPWQQRLIAEPVRSAPHAAPLRAHAASPRAAPPRRARRKVPA